MKLNPNRIRGLSPGLKKFQAHNRTQSRPPKMDYENVIKKAKETISRFKDEINNSINEREKLNKYYRNDLAAIGKIKNIKLSDEEKYLQPATPSNKIKPYNQSSYSKNTQQEDYYKVLYNQLKDENYTLKNKIQNLERQNEINENTVKNNILQVQQMKVYIKELEDTLQQKDKEKINKFIDLKLKENSAGFYYNKNFNGGDQLLKENQILKKELDKIIEENLEFKIQINTLNNELKNQNLLNNNDTIQKLNQKVFEVKKIIEDKDDDIKALKQQLDNLSSENLLLKKSLQEKKEKENFEQINNIITEKLNELKENIASNPNKSPQKQPKNPEKDEQIQKLQKKIKQLEDANKFLTADVVNKKDEINRLLVSMKELKSLTQSRKLNQSDEKQNYNTDLPSRTENIDTEKLFERYKRTVEKSCGKKNGRPELFTEYRKEIRDLKDQIDILKREKSRGKEMKEKIPILEKNIEMQRQKIFELNVQINKINTELIDKDKNITLLKEQNTNMQKEKESIDNKYNKILPKYQESSSIIEKLNSDYKALEEKYNNCNAELEKNKNELMEQKTNYDNVLKQNNDYMTRINELTNEKEIENGAKEFELEEQIDELKAQVEKLTKDNELYQNNYNEIYNENIKLKNENTLNTQTNSNNNEENMKLNDKLIKLMEENTNINESALKLKDDLKNLKEKHQKLKEELDTENTLKIKQKNDYDLLMKKYESSQNALEKLQEENLNLEQNKENLENNEKNYNETITNLKKENDNLSLNVNDLFKENKKLQDTISELDSKIAKIQNNNTLKELDNVDMVNKLKEERDAVTAEHAETLEKYNKLLNEFKVLKDELLKLNEENEKLRLEKENILNENILLNQENVKDDPYNLESDVQKNNKLIEENEALKNQLLQENEQLKNDIKILQEENSNYIKINSKLLEQENELQKSKEIIEKQKEEINDYNQIMEKTDELINENDRLKEQVEKLQEENANLKKMNGEYELQKLEQEAESNNNKFKLEKLLDPSSDAEIKYNQLYDELQRAKTFETKVYDLEEEKKVYESRIEKLYGQIKMQKNTIKQQEEMLNQKKSSFVQIVQEEKFSLSNSKAKADAKRNVDEIDDLINLSKAANNLKIEDQSEAELQKLRTDINLITKEKELLQEKNELLQNKVNELQYLSFLTKDELITQNMTLKQANEDLENMIKIKQNENLSDNQLQFSESDSKAAQKNMSEFLFKNQLNQAKLENDNLKEIIQGLRSEIKNLSKLTDETEAKKWKTEFEREQRNILKLNEYIAKLEKDKGYFEQMKNLKNMLEVKDQMIKTLLDQIKEYQNQVDFIISGTSNEDKDRQIEMLVNEVKGLREKYLDESSLGGRINNFKDFSDCMKNIKEYIEKYCKDCEVKEDLKRLDDLIRVYNENDQIAHNRMIEKIFEKSCQ